MAANVPGRTTVVAPARRWWQLLIAALAVVLLLGAGGTAQAQWGGRFGGRSFGGYGRSFGGYGGGGYRFGSPYRGYRPYGAYRYGAPYYGPRFFYGGPIFWGLPAPVVGIGSLLTILAVMALLGAIAARRQRAADGGLTEYDGVDVWERGELLRRQPIQVLRAQLALLATAQHVRDQLDRLARTGDTSSPEGLTRLLNETAISLVREQAYWYAGFVGQETFQQSGAAERRFEEVVNEERSRLDGETVSHIGGRLTEGPAGGPPPAQRDKVGRYLVVTLLLAVEGPLLEDRHQPTAAEMRSAMLKLASIPPSQLRGLEVIWVPSAPGDALDEDDLLVRYPALSTL
jgi:uncharacterized membrane protein